MSNIDNHFCNNGNPYVKKEDYTNRVQKFFEEFEDVIPLIVKEYDDLEEKAKTKPCKAFNEKMDGLAALKEFHDNNKGFKDAFYWYVTQPKESKGN